MDVYGIMMHYGMVKRLIYFPKLYRPDTRLSIWLDDASPTKTSKNESQQNLQDTGIFDEKRSWYPVDFPFNPILWIIQDPHPILIQHSPTLVQCYAIEIHEELCPSASAHPSPASQSFQAAIRT